MLEPERSIAQQAISLGLGAEPKLSRQLCHSLAERRVVENARSARMITRERHHLGVAIGTEDGESQKVDGKGDEEQEPSGPARMQQRFQYRGRNLVRPSRYPDRMWVSPVASGVSATERNSDSR